MNSGTAGTLATLAGWLAAAALVGAGLALFRALRVLLWLMRLPRHRVVLLAARFRGRRLAATRATARAEGARATAATEEVRRLRAELRLARAERDEALARLDGVAEDARFAEAKRAFALRFHPDRLPRTAPDRALRVAIFREHWAELRRIERG